MATTILGSAQSEQQHPAEPRWGIPPPTRLHWMRLFLRKTWTDAQRHLLRYRFWGIVWLATQFPFFDSLLWPNQPEQEEQEEQDDGETAVSVVGLWDRFLHSPDVDYNTVFARGLETAATSRSQRQRELVEAAQDDIGWVDSVIQQLPEERRENNLVLGLRNFCRAMRNWQLRATANAVQLCAQFLSTAMSGDRQPNDPEARRVVHEYNRRTAYQRLTLQELAERTLAVALEQQTELRRTLTGVLFNNVSADIANVLQAVLGDIPLPQHSQQEDDERFLQLAEEYGMIMFMLEQLFPPLSQEELQEFRGAVGRDDEQ